MCSINTVYLYNYIYQSKRSIYKLYYDVKKKKKKIKEKTQQQIIDNQ